MTMDTIVSLIDGRAKLSGTATTVANSGATTTITETVLGTVGDFKIDSGFAAVTGVATAQTDAALLADGIRIVIVDPAGTVVEIITVAKWLKTGTDRFEAFFETLSRRPILPVNCSIRSVFRSVDTNGVATGAYQLSLQGWRLRIS